MKNQLIGVSHSLVSYGETYNIFDNDQGLHLKILYATYKIFKVSMNKDNGIVRTNSFFNLRNQPNHYLAEAAIINDLSIYPYFYLIDSGALNISLNKELEINNVF